MTNEEFISLVEQQHQRRLRLMQRPEKSRTAGNTDRLIQFRRMAKMNKCSEMSTAMNLCSKQFTDIIDMADNSHPKSGDIKYLRELISDVQNYLDITLVLAEEKAGN